MAAPTISPFFDPYDNDKAGKPAAGSTTDLDSSPLEAASRPQKRKRKWILVSRPVYPVV